TATVARPTLPFSAKPADMRRRWIWAGVLAVAAGFVGVHTWLSYRVQQAGNAPSPLGARQFGAVVAPQAATPPQAPVVVSPAAVIPVEPPARTEPSPAAQETPKVTAPENARPVPATPL